MPKKIYDIIPPEVAKKQERQIKNFVSGKKNADSDLKTARKRRTAKYSAPEPRKFPLAKVTAGVCFLVLIVCGYFYFKLQRADIELLMKTELISFNGKITADKTQTSADLEKNVIPAQYIETEKELWQEFPATGNTSNTGKASGTIIVYNKFSPATAITLKTGTHFLSDSGKYFISANKIVIPAAKIQSGKTVPGSVAVTITATEAGDAYNISPAKFSVPKLTGTAYYYAVYAESTEAMAGGFSEPKKQATEEDIKNAKDTLVKKLFEDALNSLKSENSANYIFLDSGISKEVIEASSAVKAGAVVDKFNEQVKVKVGALVFKKSDLEKFAGSYMESQLDDSRTFLSDSLSMDYTAEPAEFQSGKMAVNLTFSGKNYATVDKNDLISLFRQKSAVQVKEIIDSKFGEKVAQIKVNLRPFWTLKVPGDINKIKLDLEFHRPAQNY